MYCASGMKTLGDIMLYALEITSPGIFMFYARRMNIPGD